ncbi:MAG: two-component system response regulator [Anaerolineales bacterium]|nr:two-component system response regulator [Anaerolineales bacterium]MCX7755632.1 two-component system response regulator [Anaerolineales bacterium]MDW8279283.1 two-component system response regulator [Anaerolineales bacterium]
MNAPLKKPTLLIVDDAPENLEMLATILKRNYTIKVATSGKKALDLASNPAALPDLILLDVMMPDMDGYEVCRILKVSDLTRKIPVIFISALGEVDDESRGFEVGGVDYIIKPVNAATVCARVRTHLALYDQNRALEEMVRERTRELMHTQDVTIVGFSTLAEYRNQETGWHILATQQYVGLLARYLSPHPRFAHFLTSDNIELLIKSAPLHDIGKIAVPDRILLKPDTLTPEEFEEIKKHTIYGRDALARAEQALGDVRSSFLRLAKEIAYTHHERWDGTGYPQGLAGEDIPISGRLMALADVYDALVSPRVYKDAFPHEEATQIIQKERGKHFDPDVVDAFLDLQDVFHNIAESMTNRNVAEPV